jgi:hypothetical protein
VTEFREDPYGDDGNEITLDDWPAVFTNIPVWILLADLSDRAYRMYCFLAEHINSQLRKEPMAKRIAFPKQKAIALVLGLKDDRKVARYRTELAVLGAIEVEEYRYMGGMRRGYRYKVRFNPPPGYSGAVSLEHFYDSHPELGSHAKWEGRRTAALQKPAGKVPAQGSAPQPGAAPDAKPGPAARKPSKGRGVKEVQLDPAVLRVLDAFPEALRAAMRETAHTDTPKTLVTAVTKALKGRTAEQLVDRVSRRWWSHGYMKKFEAGQLERPVGAAVAMLQHGECPDPQCEDTKILGTSEACVLCEERGKEHKAGHARARKAEQAEAAAAARRAQCPSCLQDRGTGGEVCPSCVEGFEKAIATASERAAAQEGGRPGWQRGWSERVQAEVLAEAAAAREQARESGASRFAQYMAAVDVVQESVERREAEIKREIAAALEDRYREAEALQGQPAPAELKKVPCSGTRWDDSPCERVTDSEDGLCGRCRGAQLAQQQDLAAAH